MYAVVLCGSKQYKVRAGDIVEVEKLDKKVGDKIDLEVLLTVDGEKVLAAKDAKAKATGEVVEHGKQRKVVVYKYKAKKNVRKKLGHRQQYTKLKISL